MNRFFWKYIDKNTGYFFSHKNIGKNIDSILLKNIGKYTDFSSSSRISAKTLIFFLLKNIGNNTDQID